MGFGRGAYVNPAIKKQPTRRDYYPVCNSSLFGDQLRTLQGLPDDFADRFAYYNDTLIPVMLLWNELGGQPEKELLAWFKVSEQFFKDLNYSKDEYYEYMRTKEIVAANPKFNLVEYDYSYNDLNIYNSIMVNSSLLDNFGFYLTADSLVYRHGSFETAVEFWFTDFGRGVQSISNMVLNNQGDEIDKPLLCAISSLRMQMTMNVNPKAYYDIDSTINGSNWIDICIPVEFTDSKGKLWEGSTFWFYPNESLFRNLPDSIGDPMRREYNSNVAPKLRGTELEGSLYVIGPGIRMPDSIINKKSVEETVPCEYFPSFCEGLPGVDDLNVYPNPVVDILNLEITVSRKKDIDFRIFDISGRLMIDEMETKNCPDAGMYRHQIDVSSLEKGFYLLVLTDEEGARMTRRVIRQ